MHIYINILVHEKSNFFLGPSGQKTLRKKSKLGEIIKLADWAWTRARIAAREVSLHPSGDTELRVKARYRINQSVIA